MTLELDSATHSYRRNGVVIPGVTEVMREAGFIDDAWFTEESSWRGTAIHLACQLEDEQDLDPNSVDEAIKPYLEAYRKFKRELHFLPQEIEVMRYGNIGGMEVAGTPDRIGLLGALRIVLDIKSGEVRPETALQLAAYSELAKVQHRLALRLGADGKYAIRVFPVRERLRELRQFQAALANWWWKQNGN